MRLLTNRQILDNAFEFAQRGIAYDEAMSIPYLRAALIGTVRALQKTAARHAQAMRRAPYND